MLAPCTGAAMSPGGTDPPRPGASGVQHLRARIWGSRAPSTLSEGRVALVGVKIGEDRGGQSAQTVS
jgi:hypothetical protein